MGLMLRGAGRVLPASLMASIALWSFSQNASVVVFSWLVLRLSDSTVAVALLFALRAAPRIVVGLPAGVLADRLGHRRSVAVSNDVAAAILAALAACAAAHALGLAVIFAAAVPLSCCDALRLAGMQALANDLAAGGRTGNGLAAMNLATQSFAFAGSLAGGLLLGPAGQAACLALTALSQAAAGWSARRTPPAPESAQGSPALGSLRRGLQLLRRQRQLRVLAGLVMAAEIALFSSQAVLPSYARDALGGGTATLGFLLAAMSLGAVATLAALTAVRVRGAWFMLFTASLVSGAGLLAQSLAPGLGTALAAVTVLGGALATVDTATQSLLQHNAPAGQRSAAAGVWVFGIGIAPIGQLCLGALATAIGIRPALAGFAIAALLATCVLGGIGHRRWSRAATRPGGSPAGSAGGNP